MNNYLQRAGAIMQRINLLATISEDDHCITRTFGTEAFITGALQVKKWMEEAGLQTRLDNIGNIRGRLLCGNEQAKTLVIASHIDTVINAGKFDGPLGVLMGLDLIGHVIVTKQSLPFNIELIAFSDEEGCRFHTTYLGSKVVAGSFDSNILLKEDKGGTSLQQAIWNIRGNVDELMYDAIPKEKWLGYFEIHIEQGPVLYQNKIPVAAVTAIAGQKRAELIFTGMAGHAGTVPMDMRKDALAAAADFILAAEDFAQHNKNRVVATVGKLDIIHAASNVIPGTVTCSIDIRSADEITLDTAEESLREILTAIGNKRDIATDWRSIQQSKPVTCDPTFTTTLSEAITASGYELVELVSGAGHDAVPISIVAPVSMLFVRCFEGISHNPLEDVELDDMAAAIKVGDQFINNLIKKHSS